MTGMAGAGFEGAAAGSAQPPVEVKASPTPAAFRPSHSVVSLGVVQINRISPYLRHLPEEARAEVLVCPFSTAALFDGQLYSWDEEIERVAAIDARHGIHYRGQILTGMRIADNTPENPGPSYEQAWAAEIKAAWDRAVQTGEAATTGLAIAPCELINGRNARLEIVEAGPSLFAKLDGVNAALARQGGEPITAVSNHDFASWLITCTEDPGFAGEILHARMTNGEAFPDGKLSGYSASRPMALRVLAPAAAPA